MPFGLFKCCSYVCDPFRLPEEFESVDILGRGGFGYVVRVKNDTDEMMAVKIFYDSHGKRELKMASRLMKHNLHEHNIVKFLDWDPTPYGTALMMEIMDITLLQYIKMLKWRLMPLSDIRDIIKQMAVALDALKGIGVIHGDIKPDNIMMVDHQTRPLRVKLIDFGLAILTSEAMQGTSLQHHCYRAPEIILGLPFTEAIDMWSLGCVLAIMFTRDPLFRGRNTSLIMQGIVHHCGQPPDHLLNKGFYTKDYFLRTKTGWTIKKCLPHTDISCQYEGQIKEKRLYNKNETEALEARQCLDLLRAMLRVDPAERITPAEVLLHPFIIEASASAPDDCTNIERDHRRLLSKIPLSRYLSVEPAEAENTLQSDEQQSMNNWINSLGNPQSLRSCASTSDSEKPVTPPKEGETTNTQPTQRSSSPTIPPSRVIHVRPATAENTLRLENQEHTDSLEIHVSKTSTPVSSTSTSDREDPVTAPKERETTNIQPTQRSSSPTIPPSRVIHVRPATAENTLRLENQEDTDSLEIHVSKTSTPVSSTSTSDREDPVTAPKERETTNIQPTQRSSSPTIPPSCVIHVRPATAENTLRLEDQEDTDSLQTGLKNTSESPETITENDTTLTKDDSTVTDSDSTVTFDDFTARSTSEDFTYYGKKHLPPVTDLSSKKKKNCFRRFFSWMKKNFCSCVTCVDDD